MIVGKETKQYIPIERRLSLNYHNRGIDLFLIFHPEVSFTDLHSADNSYECLLDSCFGGVIFVLY